MTKDDLKYDHLVGRQFIMGQQDCLSLFRQFYADNFGIQIRNYARPIDWSSDKLDLMELCHEREGFEKITDWKAKDVRPADVLCMAIGERNPNHFAIALGDDQLLHHLNGRFSSVEVFRDFWRNHTSYILRHPDVPDLRPVYPDVELMDLINARTSAQT